MDFNNYSPYTPYDGNNMDQNMFEQNIFNNRNNFRK